MGAIRRSGGAGLDAQNQCAEIKLRAERKGGEVLAGTEMDKGGRPKENSSHDARGLKAIGINHTQSSRWQQAASVPEAEFEAHIAMTKDAGASAGFQLNPSFCLMNWLSVRQSLAAWSSSRARSRALTRKVKFRRRSSNGRGFGPGLFFSFPLIHDEGRAGGFSLQGEVPISPRQPR